MLLHAFQPHLSSIKPAIIVLNTYNVLWKNRTSRVWGLNCFRSRLSHTLLLNSYIPDLILQLIIYYIYIYPCNAYNGTLVQCLIVTYIPNTCFVCSLCWSEEGGAQATPCGAEAKELQHLHGGRQEHVRVERLVEGEGPCAIGRSLLKQWWRCMEWLNTLCVKQSGVAFRKRTVWDGGSV